MILRAMALWLGLAVLAVLNGAARDAWMSPRWGDTVGRAVSTLILGALITLVTLLAVGWLGPSTPGDALRIGVLWLALTLGFEFLVGHFVLRRPWAALLADYDLRRGRIWVLVLLVTLLAPLVAAQLRGLLGTAR